MSTVESILIGGRWKPGAFVGTFQAMNPSTGVPLKPIYPISSWSDIEEVIGEAWKAAQVLVNVHADRIGDFLELYARGIERYSAELINIAHEETGLPKQPRLSSVELPRTVNQLREAAQAARTRSWMLPTIDTKNAIRSRFGPLGAGVAVFGPNNFPFAFNSAAGGDFAASIVAGNPVIAKANPGHPATSRLFAEEALSAVNEAGLPEGTIQLIYQMSAEDGKRLVSHPLIGATAYTGSRQAGLVLKEEADRAGKLIYLELSSINPVVLLPGALKERGSEIVAEFVASCLMGAGQFCTNPGLIVMLATAEVESFITGVKDKFKTIEPDILLNEGVLRNLKSKIERLVRAGAEIVVGGNPRSRNECRFDNTLLRLPAGKFLQRPAVFQEEVFGNASLIVIAQDVAELLELLRCLEGNLTASIYSHTAGDDDGLYDEVARILRRKVGRVLNDKMPTGVAVSSAMNHGGPYPATAHPGFTAVGMPASVRRFAMLECYDHVRESRLPSELQNQNPEGNWRFIDGRWTIAPLTADAESND